MKKVLLVAVIAMAAVACKKSYTCKVGDIEGPAQEYTKEQADVAKAACTLGGGTWVSK